MHKKHVEQGFAHVALLCAVLVVGLIGFIGFRVYNAQNPTETLSRNSQVAESIPPVNLDGVLSVSEVTQLATRPEGVNVTGLQLQTEDGLLVYELELSNGTTLRFNAMTGEALKLADNSSKPDDANEIEEEAAALPANFSVNISLEKARQIAQEKFPDSKISKIKLDVEEGIVVLSVRFADKARVDINAADGTVVRTKVPKQKEASDNKDDKPSDSNAGKDPARSSSGHEDKSSSPDASDKHNDTPSGGNSGSGSSSSGRESDDSADDSGEIRVEGVLSRVDGSYRVAQNGTVYTIQTSQDISKLVGKAIRAEGSLQPGNVIKAEKVDAR